MLDDEKLNRRTVLQSLGASGAAAAGLSSVTTAEEQSLENGESTLREPEVRQLAELLDGIDVLEGTERFLDVSGHAVTVQELETEYGELIYTDFQSHGTEAKLVVEDIAAVAEVRRRVEAEFGPVPDESGLDALLVSRGDGVEFIRDVTADEKRKLHTSIARAERGMDIENAYYESDIDGYRVYAGHPGTGRGNGRSNDEQESDIVTYVVGEGGMALPTRDVERVEYESDDDDEVETMLFHGSCPFTWECTQCASAVAARGICVASCGSGPDPVCLACILNTSLYPAICVPCLDDCT